MLAPRIPQGPDTGQRFSEVLHLEGQIDRIPSHAPEGVLWIAAQAVPDRVADDSIKPCSRIDHSQSLPDLPHLGDGELARRRGPVFT